MNKRENNYDLLRILAAVGVVVIHVNQYYMITTHSTDPVVYILQEIMEVFTRFGVPCFVMISGAFLLKNPRNKEYKSFYKRVFVKTVLPFLIVSLMFFCFDVVMLATKGGSFAELALTYLRGSQYNLWFIPMISGLYLLTPVAIRFKESVSNRAFGITAFVWLFFAIVFVNSGKYGFPYSFACVFAYFGYFMVGNFIYENLKGKINPAIAACVAFLMYTLRIIARMTGMTWIFTGKNVYFYPTIVIGGIAVFVFFSNIRFPFSLGKPASVMLCIYLFHTFIFKIIQKVIGNRIIVDSAMTAILISALCFVLSFIAGVVFKKLYGKLIERKLL